MKQFQVYVLCINVPTTCHPEKWLKVTHCADTFRPNSFMYVRVAEDMGHALQLVLCIAVYIMELANITLNTW